MKGCKIVLGILLLTSCINVPHTYTLVGVSTKNPSENISYMVSKELGYPFYKCGMSRRDKFLLINIGRRINPDNLSSFNWSDLYLNLHDKMTLSDIADDIYLCDTIPCLDVKGLSPANSRFLFLQTGVQSDFILPTLLRKVKTYDNIKIEYKSKTDNTSIETQFIIYHLERMVKETINHNIDNFRLIDPCNGIVEENGVVIKDDDIVKMKKYNQVRRCVLFGTFSKKYAVVSDLVIVNKWKVKHSDAQGVSYSEYDAHEKSLIIGYICEIL